MTARVPGLVPNKGSSTLRMAVAVAAACTIVLGLGARATTAASPLPAQVMKGQERLDAALHGTLHADSLCGQVAGLVCTTVNVPLDRTGQVPGTIGLHVEELPAQGAPSGVMFLIAGGPGQGSAHVFDLGDPTADALYHYLFPGYTLVAYDDRGTGESGLLDCPALQVAITEDAQQNGTAA